MLERNVDICRFNSVRYGEYDSDVFVYVDAKKREFVCALCSLANDRRFHSQSSFRTPWLQELKNHLKRHVTKHDAVPERVTIMLDTALLAIQPGSVTEDQIRLVTND